MEITGDRSERKHFAPTILYLYLVSQVLPVSPVQLATLASFASFAHARTLVYPVSQASQAEQKTEVMVWQKTLQVGGETDHLIDGGRRLNSRTCQLAADLWLIFFWVKELFSVQCSRGRSHRTGKLWPKNGWFFRGAPLCQQQILKDNVFKIYEVDKLESWLEGKRPKVKKKR